MSDSLLASLALVPLSFLFGSARQALKAYDVSTGDRESSWSNVFRSVSEISLQTLLLTFPFLPFVFFPPQDSGYILPILLLGVLITLLGLQLGDVLARGKMHQSFLRLARIISWVILPLFPLGYLVYLLIGRHHHLMPDEEDEYLEELEDDVEKLDTAGREMVAGVVEFAGLTVREVMVPRIEVTGVDVETPILEISRLSSESGHSRLPVFEGSIDNVVGIVHAKDLLRVLAGDNKSLRELMRKPYFVPESKSVLQLLKEFQRDKTQIAIVVDEYGGTAGIVTLEDLIEEIVGEIHDEYDQEEKEIEEVHPGVYRVQGKLELRELEDHVELQLDDADYETLGGYILTQLGRMPEVGDVVENEQFRITVDDVDERRIGWVTLELHSPTEKNDKED